MGLRESLVVVALTKNVARFTKNKGMVCKSIRILAVHEAVVLLNGLSRKVKIKQKKNQLTRMFIIGGLPFGPLCPVGPPSECECETKGPEFICPPLVGPT